MSTLLENTLNDKIKTSPAWKSLTNAVAHRKFPIYISGAQGPFLGYLSNKLTEYVKGSCLLVTSTEKEAQVLKQDLEAFYDEVLDFPWWGTMAYKGISPQSSIFGERSQVLSYLLLNKGKKLIVTSLRAFLSPLPDTEYFRDRMTVLKKGDLFDPMELEIQLASWGYSRVPRVSVAGEFALRGEVLDIALPGAEEGLRIVFNFDQIEEIKTFDIGIQSSTGALEEVLIYPAKEMVWDDERLDVLSSHLDQIQSKDTLWFDELKATREMRGEELLYPLAFNTTTSLLDYLNEEDTVFFVEYERIQSACEPILKEYKELYRKALVDDVIAPSPEVLLLDLEKISANFQRKIFCIHLHREDGPDTFKFNYEGGRSFFGNLNFLKEEIANLLDQKYTIYVVSESASQKQRIEYMFKDMNVEVFQADISSGFQLPEQKLVVIQENEIFGRKKRVAASFKKAKSQAIDSFVELNPGDYVVHVNHGIGIFKGIERIKAAGNERDYICVEYADEERIFIPIEQVNLVQRFIGKDGQTPRIDKIGGKSWETKKGKVKKHVEDLADRLIKLYARRKETQGYAFPPDNDWQVSFEASFPYQETEDQLAAIEDIKTDMESSRPMDRLLCGDVGYGKTEVAMRAAFKGCIGGRQVAFLAPTTILAEQHYDNFTERFKRFPIRIGMLSRFVNKKEQKLTLEKLEKGEIDLLIGTHRILSKDVKFKNLGLMVIDEEQRFGVKDKEKLKEMRSSIDSLSLSATPIPRTLHMSLLKIRDMSVLKTAPRNRQPIETFVQEFNEEVIAKAIRREVERGGQVFFLHNRVETLENIQIFLQNLVPEVMVDVAHGKMSPHELEDIMHRFINGGFQVLVSTTIIENGIDIPNVNTIIIDRADMYGISQLYQLRGRVGRSGKLAYAYLLYPDGQALSEIAMKRLQVISDFTELGSGFKVAMKDLEVRGAGNLLGREQSGDILSVGFDMYIRLVEEAINARSEDRKEEAQEVLLELEYTGFIPDSYITEATEKMEIYKKIAAVTSEEDSERLFAEIYDRFGPVPDEVQSLFALSEIRILAKSLFILSLKERRGLCQIEFGKVSLINVNKVLRLIKESGGTVKLDPTRPQILIMETGSIGLKEKSEFIKDRLSKLTD
ncbi:transcription-repair coupling factor [Spirochaeta cellobiosiphila]|uniref:transcription-repair coupling factor n=1 Tax=Spirochaeta cellobiosiphila TaxID=504483 RepID=UPI0004128D50|nr:transcription-repair coupling factor [Spirochaeta cellobiosiphila]